MNKYPVFITLFLLISINSIAKKNQQTLYPVACADKYCYLNSDGQLAFKDSFAVASIFVDGLAMVRTSGPDGKCGYINIAGKFVIPPKYSGATDFSEGMAFVATKPGVYKAINEKGRVKFSIKASTVADFHDGLAAFSVYNEDSGHYANYGSMGDDTLRIDAVRYGFINKKGKVVIKPQFYMATTFSNGLCPVMNKDRKWGYINKEGKLFIPHKYYAAGIFKNGMAAVSKAGGYGIIDTTGRFIILPVYDNLIVDGDKIIFSARGMHTNGYGWMNKDLKILVTPKYQSVRPFGNSKYAAVKYKNKWGYIDETGKFIAKPQFFMVYQWHGNAAVAITGDQSYNHSLVLVHTNGITTSFPYYIFLNEPDYLSDPDNAGYINGLMQNHEVLIDPEAITAARKFIKAFLTQDYKVCRDLVIVPSDKAHYTQLAKYSGALFDLGDKPTKEKLWYAIKFITITNGMIEVHFGTSMDIINDNESEDYLKLVRKNNKWWVIPMIR